MMPIGVTSTSGVDPVLGGSSYNFGVAPVYNKGIQPMTLALIAGGVFLALFLLRKK